jgi:hypothetical protein
MILNALIAFQRSIEPHTILRSHAPAGTPAQGISMSIESGEIDSALMPLRPPLSALMLTSAEAPERLESEINNERGTIIIEKH